MDLQAGVPQPGPGPGEPHRDVARVDTEERGGHLGLLAFHLHVPQQAPRGFGEPLEGGGHEPPVPGRPQPGRRTAGPGAQVGVEHVAPVVGRPLLRDPADGDQQGRPPRRRGSALPPRVLEQAGEGGGGEHSGGVGPGHAQARVGVHGLSVPGEQFLDRPVDGTFTAGLLELGGEFRVGHLARHAGPGGMRHGPVVHVHFPPQPLGARPGTDR